MTVADFHDPRSLQTSDCEFIDGMHGGDLLYAKMLQEIARRDPRLAPYVDEAYIAKVAHDYSDLAMIPKKDITSEPETDFLKLGCRKSAQYSRSDSSTH